MAGPSLGTAYVQVVASADGIKGSLTKALSGEAGVAGSNAGSTIAGKIKAAIVSAGIGIALVSGFKAAISETGQLQQSYIGGLDTLYGDAADKAREYARAAQQAGVSQSTFSDQAVSFGAALKQAYGGDATKALEAANTAILDMTDNAAKMGTPLQSIQDAYQGFAKQNYTMLDNLKLGYGGTKTEMERLLADAQKISGVKYDISNLGDVYSAIHVIQGELGLTGVAAKEASTTLTGSFEAMKAAWANLLGNIGLGENVEASMKNFTDAMSTYLFGNLIPTIGNILKGLPAAFGTFLQSGMPKLAKAGMDLIKSITNGAKNQLPTLISQMVNGITNLTKSFAANFDKFISAGLNLVLSIAIGIAKGLPKLIESAPTIITNVVKGLVSSLPTIISTGLKIIAALASGIIKALPKIVAAMPKIIKGITSAITNVSWNKLGITVIKGIASGITSTLGNIKNAIGKAKDAIISPIKTAVEKVKGFFPLSIGKIFSNLKIPTINVSGGKAPFGIGGFGTKPKISVSWNAKAMDNPYLFSNATLFGAGEKGDEVLYGRNALMRDIAEATGGGATVYNYITVNGADDPEDWAKKLVRQMKLEIRSI